VDEAIQLGLRGRVSLQPDPITWSRALRTTTGLQEEPLTFEIAEAAASLALATRDPMDRLLVATAKVRRLTLVTADRRLAKVPGVDVLAFRPTR
jgi:PIN domain nuclease of toxin-antitoxin system